MRTRYLLLVLLAFSACKPGRKVNTSFYYWKTVYRQNASEDAYIKNLHVHKLYVRIMDVDMGEDGVNPIPISPVTFQSKLVDTLQIVPVVFIVNNILRNLSHPAIAELSKKIIRFVDGKVQQSGKNNYNELQIDCDWTAETRENYFYLLQQIKPLLAGKKLAVTLRLHQIKNQKTSGIPPADKVLLMCYNMGNLRKYGTQNSILEVSELKKYIGSNLSAYPMAMDIGLPLFNWAVAFRKKEYTGIDKQLNLERLNRSGDFVSNGNNMFNAKTDLPAYGLQKGDEVRWENSDIKNIQQVAAYISGYLKPGDVNLVYFNLDDAIVKQYKYEELQNTANLLH